MLWETADERYRGSVIPPLARALHGRVEASPGARGFLPPWLDISSLNRIEDSLSAASETITRWVIRKEFALHNIPGRIKCSVEAGPGLAALMNVIREGPESWWVRQRPQAVREWVRNRGLTVTQAVIDRQLRTFGKDANSPADLRDTPESRELVAFCLENLGDPVQRPGQWTEMSPRGKAIFNWLLVRDEFGKIISSFENSADDIRRARFWKKSLSSLLDARYVVATNGVAVCCMLIRMTATKAYLFVEFGTTGNACYVYERPDWTASLRALVPATMSYSVGEFKNRDSSRGGYYLFDASIARWSHTGSWEDRFSDKMRKLKRGWG